MKIVVITDKYPPFHVGGYELECRDVVESLAARGHAITVILSTHGVGSPRVEGNIHRVLRQINDEIPEEVYKVKRSKPLTFIKAQLKMRSIGLYNKRVVGSMLDEIRPDIVFLWNLGRLTINPFLEVVDRNLPFVARIAGYWLSDEVNYFTTKSPLKNLLRRVLLSVYGDVRRGIEKGMYLPPSHFTGKPIIAAGVPADRVRPVYCLARVPKDIPELPPSDSCFRMLYSGRVCRDKGVHVAVEAASLLASDPDVGSFSIDITGPEDHDYAENLRQDIKAKKLDDRIHFWGMIPREQLEEMRQSYHAFLFTSMWAEPGAMVLIESMAYGLPPIASPAGGTAEYLVDGENSLVFPMGNGKAMAAAIKKLMLDRNLLVKIRDGARRTAIERFEFNKIVDEYENYLVQVLEESKVRESKSGERLGKG